MSRPYVKTLAKKNITACQNCKKPYTAFCHTYIGIMIDGKTQQVGNCCASLITTRLGFGVFVPPEVDRSNIIIALNVHPWAASQQ